MSRLESPIFPLLGASGRAAMLRWPTAYVGERCEDGMRSFISVSLLMFSTIASMFLLVRRSPLSSYESQSSQT